MASSATSYSQRDVSRHPHLLEEVDEAEVSRGGNNNVEAVNSIQNVLTTAFSTAYQQLWDYYLALINNTSSSSTTAGVGVAGKRKGSGSVGLQHSGDIIISSSSNSRRSSRGSSGGSNSRRGSKVQEEEVKVPAAAAPPVFNSGMMVGVALGSAVLCYQLFLADLLNLLQRGAALCVPLFCTASAFCLLALCLRKSWTATSVYLLLASCFAGEFVAQAVLGHEDVSRPALVSVLLIAVSVASVVSSLELPHNVLVISFLSFVRLFACSSLVDLPNWIRPFFAYTMGVGGIIGAKYLEHRLQPSPVVPVAVTVAPGPEAKVPLIKRRRSSAMSPAVTSFSSRAGRRTSLPALIQKPQTPTSSYESAIIAEAHGLISDMLADTTLSPNVVSGLRSVSNLLKPPDNHNQGHKPKVSPLVSLTEAASYGSDSEDLPYTGERPSSLPKRLRRSLPPSLIRRMSTSTWTTTTSATGLPTLEPEPCRTRSTSLRHSRDSTPGSSPTASRSNSPSPSSPAGGTLGGSISLTIPKSRSFSVAAVTPQQQPPSTVKRGSVRERRSFQHGSGGGSGSGTGASGTPDGSKSAPVLYPGGGDNNKQLLSPAVKPDDSNNTNDTMTPMTLTPTTPQTTPITATPMTMIGMTPTPGKDMPLLSRRLNITSDYESNDSPSSSDHSDNVMASYGGSGGGGEDGVPGHHLTRRIGGGDRKEHDKQIDNSSHDNETTTTTAATDSSAYITSPSPSQSQNTTTSSLLSESQLTTTVASGTELPGATTTQQEDAVTSAIESAANEGGDEEEEEEEEEETEREEDEEVEEACRKAEEEDNRLAVDIYETKHMDVMDITKLNQWDYPVFELAELKPDTILSIVAHKLFVETGLFDTFRIPLREFLEFFHVLELGYQNKPYHNRIHATDVLHGVYYFTTQPIPGFTQTNPEPSYRASGDTGDGEKSGHRANSFLAEDSYGILGGNFPPLELMALYTAAAMHDYDHPGRTNAFLVATGAPLAILYNDRSVLECHHSASAWSLFLSDDRYNWLQGLDKTEFKRFRFLVIEAILATDLKQHFELLAEFNAKVNDEDAPGIDWTSESDRLMVANMVIKMADINGPCKRKDLHVTWTERISEEFYEQGDEEARLGLPISPYMDRKSPQLAKLQESFINHLVAPLCNAVGGAGLIPGMWEEETGNGNGSGNHDDASAEGTSESDRGESTGRDTEDDDNDGATGGGGSSPGKPQQERKMMCWLTKHLKDNHDMWVSYLKMEERQKENNKHTEIPKEVIQRALSLSEKGNTQDMEMEPIKEEDTPPPSATFTPLPTIPSPSSTNQEAAANSPSTNQSAPTLSTIQEAPKSANQNAPNSSSNQNTPNSSATANQNATNSHQSQ